MRGGQEPKPPAHVLGLATHVLGLAMRHDGPETHWSLTSSGDRVRGRTLKPAHAGPHPVFLLASPDGCADSAFVESAAAAWCARAALVVFDLPLCGSRKSDKLTSLALDDRLPLAQRLRPELEAQVAWDFRQVLALIASDPELDSARVTFVGVGLGGRLARAFLAEPNALARSEISPDDTQPASWFRAIAERV